MIQVCEYEPNDLLTTAKDDRIYRTTETNSHTYRKRESKSGKSSGWGPPDSLLLIGDILDQLQSIDQA